MMCASGVMHSVPPGLIDDLQLTFLGRWDDRVLPSIVEETLKCVVAQFTASELLTKREMVSTRIRNLLEDRYLPIIRPYFPCSWFFPLRFLYTQPKPSLSTHSRAGEFNIVVEDVSITHLTFGSEFMAAVESKQVGETRWTCFASNLYSSSGMASIGMCKHL